MEYFKLPASDERISRIGFGCAAISGFDYGVVDERESIEAIRAAWDAGVNLFDTANVYGFGRAEEVLGKALGNDRHAAMIATKFGVGWDESGKTFRDSSVKGMTASLEASLRRLRLECIPIYLIHWHDGITPLAELMGSLGACREQGKIRYLGCSNFTAQMVHDASRITALDFIQLPFNLVRTEHGRQLVESADRMRMTTMVYDVLARGLLSGKYDRNARFGENDTRSRDPYFAGDYFESNLEMVERLKVIARRHQKTAAQVAIRWALDQPFVHCALLGSKRGAQVIENSDVFGWSLTSEDHVALGPTGTM